MAYHYGSARRMLCSDRARAYRAEQLAYFEDMQLVFYATLRIMWRSRRRRAFFQYYMAMADNAYMAWRDDMLRFGIQDGWDEAGP